MSEHGGGGGGGEDGVLSRMVALIGFKVNTHGLEGLNHRLEHIKHAVELIAGIKVIEAIHSLGERFAGLGESLESSALQAGLTTDELQKLQYAGTQNAISAEDMTMALVRLNRTMFQAQKGSKQALDTFARLGISKEQLAGFSSAKDAMYAVADGVNRLGTQQEKVGVLMQLLGRSAAKYLKLFVEGSEGLIALGARAEDVGAIISAKSIENLAHFEDAASSIKLVMRAFLANVAGSFIPGITRGLRSLEEAWGRNKKVVTETLAYLADRLGFYLYVAKQFFDVFVELVHRALYGGEGIGGTIHDFLTRVEKFALRVVNSVSKSITELSNNGSLSAFMSELTKLLEAAKTLGVDVVEMFDGIANGMGKLGGVDTNGIDKTTNMLNAALAVLTTITQLSTMALTGWHDIFSGNLLTATNDAMKASIEQSKYDKILAGQSFVDTTGRLVNGLDATGVFASQASALTPPAGAPSVASQFVPQLTSTINVTGSPGMSTEQLAKQIADKQRLVMSQMLRESRRDFASPLAY